jgi:hypothetical protein
LPGEAGASFYAAFWRGGSGGASTAGSEVQHLKCSMRCSRQNDASATCRATIP